MYWIDNLHFDGVPAAILAAVIPLFAKFVSEHHVFSRKKSKNLYRLSQARKYNETSSCALQLAVKNAMGVELPGDMIRFALQRDDALATLRSVKSAIKLIKLSRDGASFTPKQENLRMTFKNKMKACVVLILLIYIPFSFLVPICHVLTGFIAWLYFSFVISAVSILLVKGSRYDAADRLMHAATFFPLPRTRQGEPSQDQPDAAAA